MIPKRIQRKRIKGWRVPKGAVYVGRPSKWGNPFKVERAAAERGGPLDMWAVTHGGQKLIRYDDRDEAIADAVDRYKRAVWHESHHVGPEIRDQLAGKDLVCWCPLDQPCHADVLLAIANEGAS